MSQEIVIQTNNLSKVYGGEVRALDNLNLQVRRGEIFGYLGPNGAGKTTTIRMLLDFIRPTSGSASILGMDVREQSVDIHRRIGFMPGELNLWKNRTGTQVVNYIAKIRGNDKDQLREAGYLADRLKLDLSKKVRDYSTGNKRKLGLTLALMHKPDLLILDEPTSGLDPLMQQTFNHMMEEVRDDGRTVFLSSHLLSEVQAICGRVAILRDGDLKAIETVENLMQVGFRNVSMTFRDAVPQAWEPRLGEIEGVDDVFRSGNTLRLKLFGDFDPLMRAVNDGYLEDMHIEDPSLEEIFLSFYGEEVVRERV
ncbi:MAG: ABC transporter ATP-binding protein [Aggregatilineales bacterium]